MDKSIHIVKLYYVLALRFLYSVVTAPPREDTRACLQRKTGVVKIIFSKHEFDKIPYRCVCIRLCLFYFVTFCSETRTSDKHVSELFKINAGMTLFAVVGDKTAPHIGTSCRSRVATNLRVTIGQYRRPFQDAGITYHATLVSPSAFH